MLRRLLLFTLSGAFAAAQTVTAAPGDVTVRIGLMSETYCVGEGKLSPVLEQTLRHNQDLPGPDGLTLHVRVKVVYENRRSEPVLIPNAFIDRFEFTVAGDTTTFVLHQTGLNFQPSDALRSLSEALKSDGPPRNRFAIEIPPRGSKAFEEFGSITVRSPTGTLLGKAIRLTVPRDHGSTLNPADAQKLQEHWKEYGKLWTGKVEPEPIDLTISRDPYAPKCGQ